LTNVRDQLAGPIEDGKGLGLKIRIIQNIEHLCPELRLQLFAPYVLVLEY
jgi:hypothetical protein